jgi:hypothetical protein
MDAARLASPVGDGILWHPARLQDIWDVPSRTLILFDFYRAGAVTRQQPWSWWRPKGKRVIAHQYMTDFLLRPQPPARCGFEPEEGAELERYDIGKCAKCDRMDRGEAPEQATGTVAGVKVAARERGGPGSR